jgi:hypothetical protein
MGADIGVEASGVKVDRDDHLADLCQGGMDPTWDRGEGLGAVVRA